MIPYVNFNFFEIFLIWQRSAFQKTSTKLSIMGYKMGWVNEMNIGVEYGVLMVLKTWGAIWGANDFKNMGRNMGCQYKEVFNHFFGFSSKRRL